MSIEELSAQIASLTVDVQQRDASIVGLVDAVHVYEKEAENTKTQIAELTQKVATLTQQLAEKDSIINEYRDALLDQIHKLLK